MFLFARREWVARNTGTLLKNQHTTFCLQSQNAPAERGHNGLELHKENLGLVALVKNLEDSHLDPCTVISLYCRSSLSHAELSTPCSISLGEAMAPPIGIPLTTPCGVYTLSTVRGSLSD